jgi:hypothetical protein
MATRVVVVLALLVATIHAECDLSGDWIAFDFISFDVQKFSAVSIQQAAGSVTVRCTDKQFCPWQSASGALNASALSLNTNGNTHIDGVVHSTCDIITTGIPIRVSANWYRIKPGYKKVHMIFMTHLDVGYTQETSMDVLEQYRSQWFPKAYTTIAELPANTFRWTSHPWLILELLNNATGTVTAADIE